MDNVRNFIENEEGMETIEYLVVLAVVAGLIAIVVGVAKSVKTKGTSIAGKLDDYAKNGT